MLREPRVLRESRELRELRELREPRVERVGRSKRLLDKRESLTGLAFITFAKPQRLPKARRYQTIQAIVAIA